MPVTLALRATATGAAKDLLDTVRGAIGKLSTAELDAVRDERIRRSTQPDTARAVPRRPAAGGPGVVQRP